MGIISWRRESLFLAIAGMESCLVIAWSRLLFGHSEAVVGGLSWWSVWVLCIVALLAARTLGGMELRRGYWAIGVVALFSSFLLLQVNLGGMLLSPGRLGPPSTFAGILTLLLGLLVWYRALGIPVQAGDMRSIVRQFQIGLLILVGSVLLASRSPSQMTDLVIAYFGFGLLAVALTRIEEVARAEPTGAAPFDLKWAVTLATTLLAAGSATLLATRVITVETARWLLRPFAVLLNVVLYLSVLIITQMVMQLVPVLRWIFGDLSLRELDEGMEDLRRFTAPFPQEETPDTVRLHPQFVEALQISLVVAVVLIALWVVVRSFRGWRARQYATPGGIREAVEPEGTLTEDLAAFLREQWRRLRAADLRRLFERTGTGSARAIYANLLALFAAADHPRRPEQTPHEYEPVAREALSTRQVDIHAITEAYVRAHYGEMEAGAEELAHLQQAWRRIETEAKELL